MAKTLTAYNGSTLSYTYDGSLALSETWGNGPIVGTLTRSYNNDFKVIANSINDNIVNYHYDDDGLLTQVGELRFSRQRDNGLLTQTQIGNVTTQRTVNAFGEVVRETVFSGEQVYYNTLYRRDNLGRITQKTETVEGMTTAYDYHYNLAGQLIEVFRNEVSINRYDDNGNRLALNGIVVGSYDA